MYILLEIKLPYLKYNASCKNTKDAYDLQSSKFRFIIGPQTNYQQKNSVKTEIPIHDIDHFSVSIKIVMTGTK